MEQEEKKSERHYEFGQRDEDFEGKRYAGCMMEG